MLEFNLNSTESVSFVLDIAGESLPPTAKLVVPITETYSMCFNAVIEEGKATVIIPALEDVIDGGIKKDARLEVIVPHKDEDNSSSYFVPWSGDILFKSPVSVKASVEAKRPEVSVQKPIKSAVVIEEEEKHVKDPEDEGKTLETSEDKKIGEPGETKPLFEFTGYQSKFLQNRLKKPGSLEKNENHAETLSPQQKKLKNLMRQL